MLGEIAPVWRPKTRPGNKLRLNMKKLLNPKLNKERVTVIDDSSSNEKLNDDKGDSKGKRPMESERESVLTDTKMFDIFLEVRSQLLQEQQEGEIKASYLEKKVMVEEKVPCEAETEEHIGLHETPSELFPEDEEIYKRLNIPWLPNEMQTIAGNKTFDSEKKNLQISLKQYKYQV